MASRAATSREIARPPGPPPPRTPWAFAKFVKAISADPIAFTGRRFDEYGDLYYAPSGGTDLYVTRHPDHIDKVLVTEARHFIKPETGRVASMLRRFLGVGVLLANGDVWRRQRRMIQPSLGRKRLRTYADAMVALSHRHIDEWPKGDRFDLSEAMMQLTLGVVMRVLFDVDLRDKAGAATEAIEAFRGALDSPPLLPSWVPTASNRRTHKALRLADALMAELVAERQGLPADELATRDDLLSALVAATDEETGQGMSEKQLRDELLTLFFAGHETTSNALAWTFHLLSRHPEHAERLRGVVDEVLGDRPATIDDMAALAPCQAAIEEAMRLYPPVPAFGREATADVDLGDYTIPAGSEIAMWPYWAQRDERWWDEPLAFRPERFGADAPKPTPGSYQPFGGGQRTCIGKHFALMEATLILATVLHKVDLEAIEPERVRTRQAITLSPRDGLPFVVRPRS